MNPSSCMAQEVHKPWSNAVAGLCRIYLDHSEEAVKFCVSGPGSKVRHRNTGPYAVLRLRFSGYEVVLS